MYKYRSRGYDYSYPIPQKKRAAGDRVTHHHLGLGLRSACMDFDAPKRAVKMTSS